MQRSGDSKGREDPMLSPGGNTDVSGNKQPSDRTRKCCCLGITYVIWELCFLYNRIFWYTDAMKMPQSISQQKTTNAYHLQTSQRYRLHISLISKSYSWMLLIMRLKYGKDEHQKTTTTTTQANNNFSGEPSLAIYKSTNSLLWVGTLELTPAVWSLTIQPPLGTGVSLFNRTTPGLPTSKSWPSPFCLRSQLPTYCGWLWTGGTGPSPRGWGTSKSHGHGRPGSNLRSHRSEGPTRKTARLGPVVSSVFTLGGCALGLPGTRGARASSAPGGRLGQLLAITTGPGVLTGWESCSLLSWCGRLSYKAAAPKVWDLCLYSLHFRSWHYALSTAKNIWLAQHSTGLVIINQYMLTDLAGPRVPAQEDSLFSKYHPRASDKTR